MRMCFVKEREQRERKAEVKSIILYHVTLKSNYRPHSRTLAAKICLTFQCQNIIFCLLHIYLSIYLIFKTLKVFKVSLKYHRTITYLHHSPTLFTYP